MRKFGIFANKFKDKDLEFSRRLVNYIESKGGEATIFENESDIEKVECVLVLGGDGTLIRTATKVAKQGIPMVGVNLGTLGYLCELEADDAIAAIDLMMEEKYLLEKRMMLTGNKLGETSENHLALNDIVFHRSDSMCVLSFHVYVNGTLLTTYHADGIIMATPTGSTGYNMSAGGPIVDPKASLILLTPINAHNLNSKSLVLYAGDVVEIEIGSRRAENDERAIVSFDGDNCYEMCVGDRFRVSLAEVSTTICKTSNKSFLDILKKKMQNYT